MSEQTNLEKSINDLLKSRSDIKREDYLCKQKQKKLEKKKNKRKKTNTLKINGESEINHDKDDHENECDNTTENLNQITEKTHLLNGNHNKLNKKISQYDEKRQKEIEEMDRFLKEENIEIEYIDEDPKTKSKFYEEFKNVFEYFVIPKKEKKENQEDDGEDENNLELNEDNYNNNNNQNYGEYPGAADYRAENECREESKKLSKKKRKLLNRMKISDLKQKTNHPEVVEAWDCTAQDPVLLVYLKSLKNSIQVPQHWSQKRKFLQNKRGSLKPPFQLPEFIEATGISKVRDTLSADRKNLKTKMRERMQPKLGKLDIDYQILHDAFFKHQTKPPLTIFGDLYYENKEYENKMKIYKPGRISEKLRVCLGIPENSPPPWIINMQRYGPPPAYTNLKIPGVNAPIADPTAEITPNLWTAPTQEDKLVFIYDYKKKEGAEHWGDLREIDEEDYSELEEDLSISDNEVDLDHADKAHRGGENLFSFDINDIDGKASVQPPSKPGFGVDSSGILVAGLKQLPDIDLKGAIPVVPGINTNAKNTDVNSNQFFTVLEQKSVNIKKGEIFGSTHGYVLPPKADGNKDKDKDKDTSSDVSGCSDKNEKKK